MILTGCTSSASIDTALIKKKKASKRLRSIHHRWFSRWILRCSFVSHGHACLPVCSNVCLSPRPTTARQLRRYSDRVGVVSFWPLLENQVLIEPESNNRPASSSPSHRWEERLLMAVGFMSFMSHFTRQSLHQDSPDIITARLFPLSLPNPSIL